MSELIQFEDLEQSEDKFPDPDWMPNDGPIFTNFIGSLSRFTITPSSLPYTGQFSA